MNATAPLSLFAMAASDTPTRARVLAVPSSTFVVDVHLELSDPTAQGPLIRLTEAQREILKGALGVEVSAVLIRPDKVYVAA